MNPSIAINALLMEREDRLVDIAELERQIDQISGQSYPLTAPADLPSRQRRKKPKKKARPKAAAPLRLRPLDAESESAYRIRYIQKNVEHTEVHLEAKPLALLLNTPLSTLQILLIETVRTTETNEWESVELLYKNPDQ